VCWWAGVIFLVVSCARADLVVKNSDAATTRISATVYLKRALRVPAKYCDESRC
jgi:hypothetical protein